MSSANKAAEFSVGDIVRSGDSPTCIQRVAKVEMRDGRELVTCVTLWRFDSKEISSRRLSPKLHWAYVHLTREEVVAARDRLNKILAEYLPGRTGDELVDGE